MQILDKVCELWGRTLSPIETQKIINLVDEFSEDVILEAAMVSADKQRPMAYMCKVLYYVKNPLDLKPKEEKVVEVPKQSEWLKNFKDSLNKN